MLWTLALFVAIQATFWSVKEFARPELRDPEYVHKLKRLRQRLRENPNRQLVILLGSSRIAFGVRTELLDVNRVPASDEPIVFNFGMTQCTPVLERLMLRRLLDDGVRPDCVVIEFLPSVQVARHEQAEEYIHPVRLSWSDLRLLERFTDRPARLRLHWLEAQLMPCFTHRHVVLNRYAAGWVPEGNRFDDNWHGMRDWGWTPREQFRLPRSAEAQQKHRANRLPKLTELFQNWFVSGESDIALRETLSLCKAMGMRAALFWGPEPGWVRPCCPAEVVERIDAYLRCLQAEFGVPIIDGRDWLP